LVAPRAGSCREAPGFQKGALTRALVDGTGTGRPRRWLAQISGDADRTPRAVVTQRSAAARGGLETPSYMTPSEPATQIGASLDHTA